MQFDSTDLWLLIFENRAIVMDDFNYFTDDFLSNGGFQQLYTSTEYPEDFCLWDTRTITEHTANFDLNNCVDYNYYNTANQSDSAFNIDEYFVESTDNNNGILSNESPVYQNQYYDIDHNSFDSEPRTQSGDFSSYEYNSHWIDINYDDCNVSQCDQYQYIENDWDLNLDNLLLDSTFESTTSFTTELPDRTFFCNDSCNVFLKESSDNLNSNLQTFLPHQSQRSPSMPGDCIETKRQMNSATNKRKNYGETVSATDDDKSFICTFNDCGKVYAKAGHLKAHIRRHIGEKPYVCLWPNCTWKFSRSDELSRHRRSHSGIKPYKCDYCPKCFSRSDHLTKHRKVHERKMAALKVKAVWTSLPQGRPGRRPKLLVAQP